MIGEIHLNMHPESEIKTEQKMILIKIPYNNSEYI